ncbi:MAG: thiamine biosynthesis protein ApbE [Marinosulfonomonas sp.]|nr:MAG: thiamine biosynthesis protein ApbE [Marinosulfonomonas sp.]
MGTRWSADLGLPEGTDAVAVETALGKAVAQVDAQMSTWKPDSDLMRLNRAPVGDWVDIPPDLMQVLARGLEIGRASDGAFDIGMGDLVSAWGFGGDDPDTDAIRASLGHERRPAHEGLELDQANQRARKLTPLALDLSGIAKGYGVDRMMQICDDFAIGSALVALDGELRAKGLQPDGSPWSVAIEKPDYDARTPLSMLELQDGAVATSGDYRHWVDVSQTRFSHTMDRRMGGPAPPGIASVTVVAADCMTADAMATAILVMGVENGSAFAQELGLDCLILERAPIGIIRHTVGPLFHA